MGIKRGQNRATVSGASTCIFRDHRDTQLLLILLLLPVCTLIFWPSSSTLDSTRRLYSVKWIHVGFVLSRLHQNISFSLSVDNPSSQCLLTYASSRRSYHRIWLDRLWMGMCWRGGHVDQQVCSYNGDLRNFVLGASLDCLFWHSVFAEWWITACHLFVLYQSRLVNQERKKGFSVMWAVSQRRAMTEMIREKKCIRLYL